MERQTIPTRERFRMQLGISLAAAVLMLGFLVLISSLSASATDYALENPTDFIVTKDSGETVFVTPFPDIADGGGTGTWTPQSLLVDGADTYTFDATWYYPDPAATGTYPDSTYTTLDVTLAAVDDTGASLLLAPTSISPDAESVACTITETGTELSLSIPYYDGINMDAFSITSVLLAEPPDESGVAVTTDGEYYYRTEDGVTFAPMQSILVRGVSSLTSEQIYGMVAVDGPNFNGSIFPGSDVTLTVGDGYVFADEPVTEAYPEDVAATRVDDKTIILHTPATWSAETIDVTLDIRSEITVTFAASDYFSVLVDYEEAASLTWTEGVDLSFTLSSDLYQVTDWAAAVTSCTVAPTDGTAGGSEIQISTDSYGDGTGTISGDLLTADCTVTFTVDESAFQRLIGVTDASPGTGYSLEVHSRVPSGTVWSADGNSIMISIYVEADYNQSTPAVRLPAGYVAEYLEGGVLEDGQALWMYSIHPDTEGGTYPDADLSITISGIVSNDSGGSGGGGGGGSSRDDDDDDDPEPAPTIRVENELNQEGASSDTMLWPSDTTEEDGVSTTTVTDEELEALIDLAQQHAEDVEQLEGDGYKEGIIVIEDLRGSSDIHTYILELTDAQFDRISEEAWDRFTVQTPAGAMSLYGDTIQEVSGLEGAVDFTLARLEYEDRTGVDATLTVGGQAVTAFTEVYGVRIFVPYAPAEEEDVNALLMDHIREDGTVERVTESFYDESAGGVYVFTSHLSKFGVAYRPAAYDDVDASHWANPYVTFLAARGLLEEGTSFRPDDPATRGELLDLVTRALSAVNLPSQAVEVYTDVSVSDPVARAAAWLYFNNLAGDLIRGETLDAGAAITREDMAALLGDTASGVGLRLRSRGLDTGYTDLDEIAGYARQSVLRLRAAGILEMPENYKFSPKATLNRGEMAQIVATLLSNL